jgi:hypothetical protein
MAKSKVPEIRIEPLEKKGQFLVHHSQDTMGSGPYKAPKKFAFGSHAEMVKHVAQVTKPKGPSSFKDALMSLKNNK